MLLDVKPFPCPAFEPRGRGKGEGFFLVQTFLVLLLFAGQGDALVVTNDALVADLAALLTLGSVTTYQPSWRIDASPLSLETPDVAVATCCPRRCPGLVNGASNGAGFALIVPF
jgi:hypothetical protein